PAALIVHFALSPTVPGHAFEGMSIPLGVLAVRGMRSLRLPSPAIAAMVAALTIPGLVFTAQFLHDQVTSGAQPYLVGVSERHALGYLGHERQPGGVLTTARLGAAIPA